MIQSLCEHLRTYSSLRWPKPIYIRVGYAPINVKPQGGGRPGVGGGFDVTSLPVAGTFDHSSSPGGRDF